MANQLPNVKLIPVGPSFVINFINVNNEQFSVTLGSEQEVSTSKAAVEFFLQNYPETRILSVIIEENKNAFIAQYVERTATPAKKPTSKKSPSKSSTKKPTKSIKKTGSTKKIKK